MLQVDSPRQISHQPPLGDGIVRESGHIGNDDIRQQHRLLVTVAVNQNIDVLQTFCQKNSVQIPTVFNTTWALVLARYLGTEQVSFTSIFEEGGVRTIGACVAVIDRNALILDVLKNMEVKLGPGSIGKSGESLKADDRPFQNSCVEFQIVGQRDASLPMLNGKIQSTVSLNRPWSSL